MIQKFSNIVVKTKGQGLYEFTIDVRNECSKSLVKNGLVNLSVLHTSASLIIQENADPDVINDLQNYFSSLVSREFDYRHKSEGDDDMPAHIRSALTNTNLSVSIKNHELILGIWQGLFIFEHRDVGRDRVVLCHVLGER